MPWKNLATVVKIEGEKVIELVEYFNNENLAHPSSRLEIEFFNKTNKKIFINKKKFDKNKSYYVLTSNFLQEGGDKMTFFKDPLELYNLAEKHEYQEKVKELAIELRTKWGKDFLVKTNLN